MLVSSSPASSQHDDVETLDNKVVQLFKAGKYTQATEVALKAVALAEKKFGNSHPALAKSLNNLASLYDVQQRYKDAEPVYIRVIEIRTKAFGEDHATLGTPLSNLAELYRKQRRYEEAEPLFERSLKILEKSLGPDHIHVSGTLQSLGVLKRDQGHYKEAIKLLSRSVDIAEHRLGTDQPALAQKWISLAVAHRLHGQFDKAEVLFKKSLDIEQKAYGPNHSAVGFTMNNLAELYLTQRRFVEAEPLYKHALRIHENAFGQDHPEVATLLMNIASLHNYEGRYEEAAILFKRALAIYEKAYGQDHLAVALCLNNVSRLNVSLEKFDEAESGYKRALGIREKQMRPNHPKIGNILNNLAAMYMTQGRYKEAEPILRRSLAIAENALGSDHPGVGVVLNNLAEVLHKSGRFDEAEKNYLRDISILQKALGAEHPRVAIRLNNLGALRKSQGRFQEAEALYFDALKISESAYGMNHPEVAIRLENLVTLYDAMGRKRDSEKVQARLAQMPAAGTRHISLFLATNRNMMGAENFGIELADKINLAHLVMQVPEQEIKNRAKRIGASMGQLEKAKSGDLTSADTLKIIRTLPIKDQKQFADNVLAAQKHSAIFKNQALIFVHGYNNSFEGAMQRATQLSFDLQFDGILMPFTWPSQATTIGYLTDVEHANKSVDALVGFLDQLRDTMPDLKINVLAHSLGNQLMLKALCKISKRTGDKKHKFGQIISAHADIDHEEFEQLTSCFQPRVEGITLYVNENDVALNLRCAGVFQCRAGNFARGYQSADVVDTTKMSKGFFRSLSEGFDHDVFVRNPLLFSDIARLILTGQRPVDKRTQEFQPTKDKQGHIFWVYDKNTDPAAVELTVAK